jgi:putative peptidoglycan lipid II flippase
MPETSLKSVTVVSVCSMVQLLLQFVFQMLLARFFGAKLQMDAYFAAMTLPMATSMIATGALANAFVPVFLESREQGGPDAAWETMNSFGFFLVAVSLLVVVLCQAAAVPLMSALHPGFSDEQKQLTTSLFRVVSWLVLTNSLTSFLQSVHNGLTKFALPAAAPLMGILTSVIYAFVFHSTKGMLAAAEAVVLGSVVNVAIQASVLVPRMRIVWRLDSASKKCLALLAPLVAGSLFGNLDPLLDRYLGSSMPEGDISHLGYAWRLTNAALLATAGAFSVVVFPTLVQHAAAKNEAGLQAETARALRFVCFTIIPVCAGLIFFREHLIADLFERGEFSAEDTKAVAVLLALFTGVIAGAAFGGIGARVFYAQGATQTPVLVGVGCFLVFGPTKFFLVGQLGVQGLAGITSVAYLASGIILLTLTFRSLGAAAFSGFVTSFIRCLLATMTACLPCFFIGDTGIPFLSGQIAAFCILVYLIVMWSVRDEFAIRLFEYLRLRKAQSG